MSDDDDDDYYYYYSDSDDDSSESDGNSSINGEPDQSEQTQITDSEPMLPSVPAYFPVEESESPGSFKDVVKVLAVVAILGILKGILGRSNKRD